MKYIPAFCCVVILLLVFRKYRPGSGAFILGTFVFIAKIVANMKSSLRMEEKKKF